MKYGWLQWRIQGGAPGAPLLRTKIFLISCNFWGKSGKIVCWCLPVEGWRPLLWGILDPPLGCSSLQKSHSDVANVDCHSQHNKHSNEIFHITNIPMKFFINSPQHKNANIANFVLAVPFEINMTNEVFNQ